MFRLILAVAILAIFASGELDRDKRFTLNPFTAAVDLASNVADSALGTVGLEAFNPIKLTSTAVGASLGGMGLVWGKQENKKCYYYWGLGFSGPESWNPERWNGEKWDAEDTGGLLHAAGNLAGMGFGLAFSNLGATEEVRVQGCKMLGMGYTSQQPGFPSKPGTCPEGPDCHGPPGKSIVNPGQPGQVIPGTPGFTTTYTIPGQPGEVAPGTPGSVVTIIRPGQPPMYLPGSPGTSTTYVQPGSPGQYIPGSPGTTTTVIHPGNPGQYTPGSPGTTTTVVHPGNPGQYIPGSPGTTTTVVHPGQPGSYTPGQPPYQTTVTTIQSQPGTYQPGTPGSVTRITIPGQPPQCQCPCQG